APRNSSATVRRPCASSTPWVPISRRGPGPVARTARACRCRRGSRRCASASSRSAEPRVTDVDLLALARSVAGSANAGAQIEAYVVRSRDVDVNAFEGEVESLATSEVVGVGVRVIVDHRQGYAWAGSLDPEVIADTLADARDNAAFGAPDESYGLVGPDQFVG